MAGFPPGVSNGPAVTSPNGVPAPFHMEPGSTYVQKLPSGKLAFVRRPVKITSLASLLTDALLYPRTGSSRTSPYGVQNGFPMVPPVETSSPINPQVYQQFPRTYDGAQYTDQIPPGMPTLLPPATQAIARNPRSPVDPGGSISQPVPVDTKHRCAICGRYRSPSYHHRHPIAPGKIPPAGVCRKCRESSTSSEESTDLGESDRKPQTRKRSRQKRHTRRNLDDREAKYVDAESMTTPFNDHKAVHQEFSCPRIFHLCPNRHDYCRFRGGNFFRGPRTPAMPEHTHHTVCANDDVYPAYYNDSDDCYFNHIRTLEPRGRSIHRGRSQEVFTRDHSHGIRGINYDRPPEESGEWSYHHQRPRRPRSVSQERRGSHEEPRRDPSVGKRQQPRSGKTLRFAGGEDWIPANAVHESRGGAPYGVSSRPLSPRPHGCYGSEGIGVSDGQNRRSFSGQPPPDAEPVLVPPGGKHRRASPETIYVSTPRRQASDRFNPPHGPITGRWSPERGTYSTRQYEPNAIPEAINGSRPRSRYPSQGERWGATPEDGESRCSSWNYRPYTVDRGSERTHNSRFPSAATYEPFDNTRGRDRFRRRQSAGVQPVNVTNW